MRAQGEWTQAGAAAVLAKAEDYLTAGEIALGGIGRVDSTAVALLLELTRQARARGLTLRFTGAPVPLMTLVQFFGLESMLPLQP